MLEILKFIFSSFCTFCGTVALILVVGGITVDVLKALNRRKDD